MKRFTGVTGNSAKHLLLDAGCYFKNYDLSKTYKQNVEAGSLLGATEGGGTFSAVPVIHNVVIDGVPTNTKGMQRIDEWTVTMTARMKEITADNIEVALAACTVSDVGNETDMAGVAGAKKITADSELDDEDYIDNLTWVGRLSGSEKPVVIVMKNALSLNGFSINPVDKSETASEYTLTGHYELEDLDKVPFDIYYPEVS